MREALRTVGSRRALPWLSPMEVWNSRGWIWVTLTANSEVPQRWGSWSEGSSPRSAEGGMTPQCSGARWGWRMRSGGTTPQDIGGPASLSPPASAGHRGKPREESSAWGTSSFLPGGSQGEEGFGLAGWLQFYSGSTRMKVRGLSDVRGSPATSREVHTEPQLFLSLERPRQSTQVRSPSFLPGESQGLEGLGTRGGPSFAEGGALAPIGAPARALSTKGLLPKTGGLSESHPCSWS